MILRGGNTCSVCRRENFERQMCTVQIFDVHCKLRGHCSSWLVGRALFYGTGGHVQFQYSGSSNNLEKRYCLRSVNSYTIGQRVLRISHFLTDRTLIPRIWYCYDTSPHPTPQQSSWASTLFFWWGRGGGVFVIASALKGSHLKEYIVKSIFVQACRPSLGADERLVFV